MRGSVWESGVCGRVCGRVVCVVNTELINTPIASFHQLSVTCSSVKQEGVWYCFSCE